ncbi:hypothetical protein BV898_06136 [Hypsibius exemplaris]|uniref:Uncharacterized protein n=1 Tax=Hypsibius exemplaris TaxID=2072580 RepID=A0A1W0WXH2_HYPEX|nr:hypothetical protein BV898_06136 [Hypsibius exemplaris]
MNHGRSKLCSILRSPSPFKWQSRLEDLSTSAWRCCTTVLLPYIFSSSVRLLNGLCGIPFLRLALKLPLAPSVSSDGSADFRLFIWFTESSQRHSCPQCRKVPFGSPSPRNTVRLFS